ncbi:autotransporter outer membrane beta-barrel domain-containing protein [Chromobacterium sp. IIBBL 290-4]|uniref:autotransporter outer membrane beta-barrel domain-containing protein n=1 Tax=Chromobacterium sp. IIBBL 290-4 TaxID=2953890 RepID=UPI0020B8EC83|nr:autotransporter domain-containing protein [Chromobacterium sp. IIBBL 290-4]UTH75062.1 autotransporter domain-containing protein [Chromobacterium sp. IIBBL 290-4]
MRNRFKALALATALALPAAAHAYSNIYYFGDSLSDIGAFGGLNSQYGTLPKGAHWTSGYAPNWTSILSTHYGLTSVANNPSNPNNTSSNGNNFAQGGAIALPYAQAIGLMSQLGISSPSIEQYGVDASSNTQILESSDQVANYLKATGGKADPNAVYSVWIGGNDIAAAAATASVDKTNTAAITFTTASANAAAAQVQALVNAGAKTVIVPNVPNLSSTSALLYQIVATTAQTLATANPALLNGLTPTQYIQKAVGAAWLTISNANLNQSNQTTVVAAAIQQANAAMGVSDAISSLSSNYSASTSGAQQLTTLFNSQVDNLLVSNGSQHNIVRANVAGLLTEIAANPGKYGFSNIFGSICADSAINPQCVPSAYNNGQTYIFSDGLHPSPQASQIIGDYVYGLLQAPYYAAAMPDSALNNARQLGGALDARYQAIRSQQRAVGTVSAFVDGAFNQDKVGFNGLAAKPKGQLYTVGIDFQATPALSIGVSMSQQQGKTDVASSGTPGTLNDRSTLMAGLISYNQDKFWVDGDFHVGSGDVDTSRVTTLGPTTVSNNGTTRQTQYGLRIGAGYKLQYGNITTGPVAGLDLAHVRVNGFAEQSGNSSSMIFGSQNLSSMVGRVGWQLDATVGQYSPYAKVSYAHEFDQNDRTVTAGLTSTVGDWTTNLGKPGSNWMEWTAGVSANFSKSVTAYGQLTATSGRNGGNQTGGNIGVAVSF